MFEQNKQELSTKETSDKYPHIRVIIDYFLLGVGIRSFLFVVLMFFYMGDYLNSKRIFMELVPILVSSMKYAALPVFLTSVIISFCKMRLSDWRNYGYIVLISLVLSCLVPVLVVPNLTMVSLVLISSVIATKLAVPKASKSIMLEQDENEYYLPKYPYIKVTLVYSFFGGLIGCVLYLCALSLFEYNFKSGMSYFIIYFGIMFGTIPAFLVRATVSFCKIRIFGWKSYGYIGVIGFLLSFISFAIIFSEFESSIFMGVLGCISAIIVAKLIVPKINGNDVKNSH